jgi:transcriptional regulator with XRE-family HTH domain
MGKTLRQQLIGMIESSGMTVYAIAKESGVDRSQLSRFLNDRGGLTLESLERLAPVLDIAIIGTKTKQTKATKKGRRRS